jgi:anti-sigma regulatory factor (Ser/Thr protein kinase)
MTMLELRLPAEPSALFLARAAVVAVGSGLPKPVISDAELLTNEVVSNAIRYANRDPPATVIVRVERGDSVRVEVVDQAPAFEPNPRGSGPGSDGGWGWFLVHAVATAWGIEPEGNGKKVWFEVGAAAR